MTDFWGIGKRMEKRLNKLGISSIRELANSNPDTLKKELGIVGLDLFFMPTVSMKVMFINLINQSHMA